MFREFLGCLCVMAGKRVFSCDGNAGLAFLRFLVFCRV